MTEGQVKLTLVKKSFWTRPSLWKGEIFVFLSLKWNIKLIVIISNLKRFSYHSRFAYHTRFAYKICMFKYHTKVFKSIVCFIMFNGKTNENVLIILHTCSNHTCIVSVSKMTGFDRFDSTCIFSYSTCTRMENVKCNVI